MLKTERVLDTQDDIGLIIDCDMWRRNGDEKGEKKGFLSSRRLMTFS